MITLTTRYLQVDSEVTMANTTRSPNLDKNINQESKTAQNKNQSQNVDQKMQGGSNQSQGLSKKSAQEGKLSERDVGANRGIEEKNAGQGNFGFREKNRTESKLDEDAELESDDIDTLEDQK